MAASANNIITYIGIPLAVIGVLPIIWNTISTLITLANVRRTLRRGRLSAMARGDVVNHIIEVELPRYTITPLHRVDHQKDYWRLSDTPSHIPGGTWTTLNWRMNAIGLKTQRMTYADQLRQPQAEVNFEALVSFLLDLGAVPDSVGFHNLRNSGLWTPLGTSLLLSPDRQLPVLGIAPLDDSDGNLSLAVWWNSQWEVRGANSLPPYWSILHGAEALSRDTKQEKEKEKEEEKEEENISSDQSSLAARKYVPAKVSTLHCQVGVNGLLDVRSPDEQIDVGQDVDIDISHIRGVTRSPSSASIWFASTLTALSTTSTTMLWNYKIPDTIMSFAKQDTIPCGILVLLDMVDESLTPEWATTFPNFVEEERDYRTRKMREDHSAFQYEGTLPPAQRAAAVQARQRKSFQEFVDRNMASRKRDQERADTRVIEALQSPKWRNTLIAEHALVWLKKKDLVPASWDLKRTVETLLYTMVTDVTFTAGIVAVLDLWRAAVQNGGIRKAEYRQLLELQNDFARATLVCAVVQDSFEVASGSLAADLQECMRMWKTVRLG